jgi:transposase
MSKTATIWNEENERSLVERYGTTTNRTLATSLGVSVPSIKKKARELGLKKTCAKRKILPSLEALVLRMSENNSYRSVADKLNISASSIHDIVNRAAKKGYQKRDKEATGKIMAETRVRLIKKERARAIFGLNQQTKLKVFPNKKKYHLRERMKRCRYDVERNSTDVFMDDETRRHANMESEAQKMGFTIKKEMVTYLPINYAFENGAAEEDIASEFARKKKQF